MRKIIAAFAAAIACVAFTVAPASAAQPMRAEVRYADLNLAQEQDAAQMLRRINRAARHVCGADERGVTSATTRRVQRECVRATVEDTIATLNAPMVTSIYAARTGHTPIMTLAAN